MDSMEIRRAAQNDLPRLMEIFSIARAFMKEKGNEGQWGPRKWPPQDLIEKDIQQGKSYIIAEDGHIYGTFFMEIGEHADPCYDEMIEGSWKYEGEYAVIHRIASSQEKKGIGEMAIAFAKSKAPHIRMDTHQDNVPMKNLLLKMGFEFRGIVMVAPGELRMAFEL